MQSFCFSDRKLLRVQKPQINQMIFFEIDITLVEMLFLTHLAFHLTSQM